MDTSSTNKKIFIALWLLCIIGALAVIPYLYFLKIFPPMISLWKVAALSAIQATLIFGVICLISYKILPKTDLNVFPSLNRENYLKQLVYPAIISGGLVGLAILFFDIAFFNRSPLLEISPSPSWAGALASIYGAVNEEVLLRLFLFTFIYFLVGKCLTIHERNRTAILWSVNIFVALMFGIGHLPAAFKLASFSSLDIFRVLFLNGIAGVVFGWLYWSKGLWTAIAAHFITDIIIHVL